MNLIGAGWYFIGGALLGVGWLAVSRGIDAEIMAATVDGFSDGYREGLRAVDDVDTAARAVGERAAANVAAIRPDRGGA